MGLALAAVATLGATEPVGQQWPRGLLEFADAFDQAQLRKDRKALERMTSDRLVFIDSSGKRQAKKEFIAGWTGPDERFNPVALLDRVVVPIGPNGGIVSAETTLTGTSGGKPFSSRIRFSDTFQRTGSRWQAAHIQVTRIG
jgi:ketosteroid isomerase-like protein